MLAVPIIIGVVALILACVNQRSLWQVTRGWQYRNREAVEPSDAALTVSRVSLVLLGIFLIVIPIVVTVSNNHTTKANAKAQAQASSAQAAGQQQVQQQGASQTASLEQEGTKVLTAIMQHTPAGQSPRSVPISQVPAWLPELTTNAYQLTPSSSYATTGQLSISNFLNDSLAGQVCITVPSQVITSAQISSGNYVTSGAGCSA